MDVQTLKIELVRQILEIDSKELLDKIYDALKKKDVDFWVNLPQDIKEEINIARNQAKVGQTQNWDEVYARLSKKAS